MYPPSLDKSNILSNMVAERTWLPWEGEQPLCMFEFRALLLFELFVTGSYESSFSTKASFPSGSGQKMFRDLKQRGW